MREYVQDFTKTNEQLHTKKSEHDRPKRRGQKKLGNVASIKIRLVIKLAIIGYVNIKKHHAAQIRTQTIDEKKFENRKLLVYI
jgi:hypothetical protein